MTTAPLSNKELLALDTSALEANLTQISLELIKHRHLLATAESCTGGMIAAACTDLAGASDWFERGFVTYSNEAKTELLGVDAALITDHGAVSEAVARAMAVGLFAAFIPIPLQMLLAAVLAITVRGNMPIAISLVWLTNPITMPVVFICTYMTGAWLMNATALPKYAMSVLGGMNMSMRPSPLKSPTSPEMVPGNVGKNTPKAAALGVFPTSGSKETMM